MDKTLLENRVLYEPENPIAMETMKCSMVDVK